jgi:TatA/E family protein of Tat protein translocase
MVALLAFGPQKLPEIARNLGKAVRAFREMQGNLHEHVTALLDDAPAELEPDESATLPPALTNRAVDREPTRSGGLHAPSRFRPPPRPSGDS